MSSIFNIRAYGLIIHNGYVLVCNERYRNMEIIKFPGGGLEFGEGLIDCLKRECVEELNIQVKNIIHFYTTDFFQPSAFNDQQQLISVYYTADVDEEIFQQFPLINNPLKNDTDLSAYWIKINKIKNLDLTFPVDRVVAEMLYTIIKG